MKLLAFPWLIFSLMGCKLECKDVPQQYKILVLPVRVEDEQAIKACKAEIDSYKSLVEYYRDERGCWYEAP